MFQIKYISSQKIKSRKTFETNKKISLWLCNWLCTLHFSCHGPQTSIVCFIIGKGSKGKYSDKATVVDFVF